MTTFYFYLSISFEVTLLFTQVYFLATLPTSSYKGPSKKNGFQKMYMVLLFSNNPRIPLFYMLTNTQQGKNAAGTQKSVKMCLLRDQIDFHNNPLSLI